MFVVKHCIKTASHNNYIINKCSTIRMASDGCVIAVCQLTSTNNKENNLKSVKQVVAEAASKSAKVFNFISFLLYRYIFNTLVLFLGSVFTRSL